MYKGEAMKYLIVFSILGVLAVPIPIDKLKSLNKSELSDALNSIQKFFNTVDRCEKSEWTGAYEHPDGTIVFVIECKDAPKVES